MSGTNQWEPRGKFISRFVLNWLDGVVTKRRAYSDDVRATYERRTAIEDRCIDFHHSADSDDDLRANNQLLMRMLDGTVRLPADLEEAVVLALPEKARWDLIRRLSARYGLLAVPEPVESVGSAHLAELVKHFGEALQAYGPLLDDGVIDVKDDPALLDKAIGETSDLLSEATYFLKTLQAARRAQAES